VASVYVHFSHVIAFAKRLCATIGQRDLCFQSRPWERPFNVWKWNPQARKSEAGTLAPIRDAETRKLVTEFGG
jgi:hypothetical protein